VARTLTAPPSTHRASPVVNACSGVPAHWLRPRSGRDRATSGRTPPRLARHLFSQGRCTCCCNWTYQRQDQNVTRRISPWRLVTPSGHKHAQRALFQRAATRAVVRRAGEGRRRDRAASRQTAGITLYLPPPTHHTPPVAVAYRRQRAHSTPAPLCARCALPASWALIYTTASTTRTYALRWGNPSYAARHWAWDSHDIARWADVGTTAHWDVDGSA